MISLKKLNVDWNFQILVETYFTEILEITEITAMCDDKQWKDPSTERNSSCLMVL